MNHKSKLINYYMQRLFGTDGIRGRANQYPITGEIAMKLGIAAGTYLKKSKQKNRVVIAKDTRLSGYLIESALTSGFISVGMDVILVGPMPTPAVSMLIKSLRADMGVMISASHNPFYDNGLKLFDCNGFKLQDDCENNIQNIILDSQINDLLVNGESLGRAKRLDDAAGRYIEHIKSSFSKNNNLNGLRIVIDCANGSAYHLAPTILWELGAEVIPISIEPNGFNINDNCGSTHPQNLVKKVLEVRADVGIALDGDADRVTICDEKGTILDGDKLLAIIATHMRELDQLKNNCIVTTQMSNGALDEYLASIGVRVHRTKVGDRYVFEAMQKFGASLGGEQSGHIILSDYSTTGDGIIAAIQILAVLVSKKIKMSKLAKIFNPFPQALKNVANKHNKDPLNDDNIKSKIIEIQNNYPEVKILVRKSGTEKLVRIMIEAKNKNLVSEIMYILEKIIQEYCA